MNNLMKKAQENVARLGTANKLIRELQGLGVTVSCVDIATPQPRLYLRTPPLLALPLRGIVRRKVDSEVMECSAVLNDCQVVWAEFAA